MARNKYPEETVKRILDAATQLFIEKGYELYVDTPTNQIFPILDEATKARLEKDFVFSNWYHLPDGRWVVRFCTSWATDPEAVAKLIEAL